MKPRKQSSGLRATSGAAKTKKGSRAAHITFSGVAVVAAGLAFTFFQKPSAFAPLQASLASSYTGDEALLQEAEDETIGVTGGTGQMAEAQSVLSAASHVSANVDVAVPVRRLTDELAAKRALVSELAKGALKRRLAALHVTGAGAQRFDFASIRGEPVASEENLAVARLEDGASGLTLPKIAPVPGKRPAIPRSAVASAKSKSKGVQLAYARDVDPNDDSSVFSGLSKVFRGNGRVSLPGRGSGIAVYEIKTATVYMPDGTKLEAHSGLGRMKDNPRYTHRRMMGSTPPNIYNLRMREARYYGVEAIRMTPTDRAAMKGRDGMLAHTPLVRGTNGSHGCVAFKNYNRFLAAFKAGKVKKMIVVPELDELPTYMASL